MIKHEVIDGRSAVVAYINDEFEPVEPGDATMIKVIFSDGEIRFGTRSAADQKKQAWLRTRARAELVLKKAPFNEADHPRVPAGSGDDSGQFAPSGGGTGSSSKPGKSKKPAKKEDFDKAGIRFSGSDNPVSERNFIEKWNSKIGIEPEEFKKQFLGGLPGSMSIRSEMGTSKFTIDGAIKDGDREVGHYTRDISPDNKSAYSSYFKLDRSATKSDIGKKVLAGNVATYEAIGIEKLSVSANIDVGGYAWAKYGYVPDQHSWNTLRGGIENRLRGSAPSPARDPNSIEADDWSMLSDDQQTSVRDHWMSDTRSEFIASEEQNWRDSGDAKNDAKRQLAEAYTDNRVTTGDIPQWINEALDDTRAAFEESGHPIPYTNRQIYDAMALEYDGDGGDDDPEISFDDEMLQNPSGYDPSQGTLPGIEPLDPSSKLTFQMREELTSGMTDAFNKKAEEDADDIEPPYYLAEQVEEYQQEYWDSKDDSEKLELAVRYNMADIEIESDEDEEEEPQMDLPAPKDELLEAVRSSDPKSIWKIADHPRGKELLLGSSWSGVLNLKDEESMKRFKAYVGKSR